MENSKLVIVTGSNKGIGYALVENLLLHDQKFLVLLTSRDINRGQEALENLIKKYPEHKNRLFYHQLDIESEKSIQDFADWLKETHKTFYILVNNAGVAYPAEIYDPDFWLEEKDVKSLININVRGTINITEKLLPYLADNGRIINISSDMGELKYQGESVQDELSNPKMTKESYMQLLDDFEKKAIKKEHVKFDYSKSIYVVTKSFLTTYTRLVLPALLKKDQTGFSVHPGWTKTDMGGENAPGTLEDSVVSTLAVVNFTLEEAKQNTGNFFDQKGRVHPF